MGTNYWLANHTTKQYLDFNGAKLGEQHNDFDRAMLQAFLQMYCIRKSPSIEYVGDDTGGWDKCSGYEDVTCDVLYSMFEDGFIPNRWQITFIYDRFQEAKRLTHLAEWMKKWDIEEGKR